MMAEQRRKAHCSFAPMGLEKLYVRANGDPLHIIRNLEDGTQQQIDPSSGAVIGVFGRNAKSGTPAHYQKQKDELVELIPGEPRRVEAVTRIFRRRFADGWGYRRIAMELNSLNFPSPRGGLWTRSAVKVILDNPVYTGRGIANRKTTALYYCRNKDRPREARHVRHTECGRPAEQIRPANEWAIIEYSALAEFLPEDIRERARAHHDAILANRERVVERQPRDKHVNRAYPRTCLMSRMAQPRWRKPWNTAVDLS
jgi:hypothetical protein